MDSRFYIYIVVKLCLKGLTLRNN